MVAPDHLPTIMTSSSSDSSLYSSNSPTQQSYYDYSPINYQTYSLSSSQVQQVSPNVAPLLEEQIAEFLNADNFDEFTQDVFTNYQQTPAPIPFLDDIIASVKSDVQKELHQAQVSSPVASDASASPIMSPSLPVPAVTLTPDNPVTFVAEDGKEYRVVLQPVEEQEQKAPKRKLSSSSCDYPKAKRAPGISLVNMSEEEIAERKKEQNRAAAQRYREKMKTSKVAETEEKRALTTRNAFLRDEAARMEKEIASLRSFIFDKVSS